MKTRALLLALPLLAIACRDNRASIQIQAICAPTKDCTFGDTCEKQYIGFPTIDVLATNHLWLFLQVENQLPLNNDTTTGKLNTNDAHIDQATVEYDGIGLGKVVYDLPNFRVPTQGTTVVSVEAIPPVTGAAATTLGAYAPVAGSTRMLVANVRLRGYLDDGSRFETGDFPIGVRVCRSPGCVSVCAATQTTCPPRSNGQFPVTCIDPTGSGTI